MQPILFTAYLITFLFLISRMKFFSLEDIPKKYVYFGFLLKVLAGSMLGLLYTYYYTDRSTADTFKFFDDSRVLFESVKTNPKHFFEMLTGINSSSGELNQYYERMNAWNNKDVLFNDNKTLVRVNTLFQFISGGYYYVHVIFINFLSFAGLIALFKLFQSHLKNKSKEIFFITLFLPSMLFWGSGLLKDGLLLFALGIFLYTFNNLITKKISKRSAILFTMSAVLLAITKFYVIITIIPGIIAWCISRNEKKVFLKFLSCYIIWVTLAFSIGQINNKYDVADLIYYKQKSFYVLGENTKANSLITIPPIEPSAQSILMNAPSAITRVLLRPTLFETKNPLILMSALENILILLIIFLCIISYRKSGMRSKPIFWFSVFFVVCMFALIGLVTPILGALVRYKVPALPFLLFIFISIYDREKLRKRFSFFRRKKRDK